MAEAASYIVLTTSNSSLSKRFRVIASGYNEYEQKTGTAERTAEGGLDITTGGVYDIREYAIRVSHTETDANYGTLADLRTFYRLNNPRGTPSNIIKFRDHYYPVPESSEMSVVIQGDFQKSLIGYALTGVNSFMVVRLKLLVIPPKRLFPYSVTFSSRFDTPRLVVDLQPGEMAFASIFDNVVLGIDLLPSSADFACTFDQVTLTNVQGPP